MSIKTNEVTPVASSYPDLNDAQMSMKNTGEVKLPSSDVGTIVDQVAKLVDSYDPTASGDADAPLFKEKESVGICTIMCKFAKPLDYLLLTLAYTGTILFAFSIPYSNILFGGMIDEVGASNSMDSVMASFLLMVYLAVFSWVTASWQNFFSDWFAQRITYRIKCAYLEALLVKEASYFDVHSPTQMASKIARETTAIQSGIGQKVCTVLGSSITFVFSYVLAFFWGWMYTAIMFAFLPTLAIVGALGSIGDVTDKVMKAQAQSTGYAEQTLSAIKVVHTYGQEELEEKNYLKYLEGAAKFSMKSVMSQSLGLGLFFGVTTIFYGYAFFWGGWLVADKVEAAYGIYTGGDVFALLLIIMIGSFFIGNIPTHYKAIRDAKVGGKLAFDVIDHVSEIQTNAHGSKMVSRDTLKGKIEFVNVGFHYGSRPDVQVLKDFSCCFEIGKTTALVGPSGSGKSTVIQLLERFYDAQKGGVLIDGEDIRNLNLQSLRQCIGYVGQEPVLFNTTIRENLQFACPKATEQEMIEALKAANAWDFIQKKLGDKGLDTQVGQAGGQLSGGQKQRIAIARAFLKKPKIMLFDEATSALDKMNERAVQTAIDNYRKETGDITIIVIAHRLSTIRTADKILVLENGSLVEEGSHDEIMSKHPSGVYSGFCAKQASSEEQQPEAALDEEVANADSGEGKVDPKVQEMKEKVDAIDKEQDDKDKAEQEEKDKVSQFDKLWPLNNPKKLIPFGVLAALITGSSNPIIGIVFAKMMGYMSATPEILAYLGAQQEPAQSGEDFFWAQTIWYSIFCAIFGVIMGIASFAQKGTFAMLGENVSKQIRCMLYTSILQKHIGFFDDREHAPSVLTSALAEDTQLINGVGAESISPQVMGGFAMLIGLAISFYFSWKMALATFGICPLLALGSTLEAKYASYMGDVAGLKEEEDTAKKEANLLCGDMINNFKTIQSFGQTDRIVQKYRDVLKPIYTKSCGQSALASMAFGFSQFSQWISIGLIFYIGGLFVNNATIDPETGRPSDSPEDILISLFSLMFGALAQGQGASFATDFNKALAAAGRIFKVLETPSKIDAVAIDKEADKIRLDLNNVRGEIEFKGVWFRYPTRKEEFVLKGLNIKINPKESVALVGESGCGKSTFVNLLMRFYDVDEGEVLLDGVDIRKINLHDLRKAVSLVMQEPIIFNYSILENILYGKLDASNSEVLENVKMANALEFIEKNDIGSDELPPAKTMIEAMEKNKDEITASIGKEKFAEEMEVLKKIEEQEKKKFFEAAEGDVDNRDQALKDVELANGFKIMCGLKGGKLSGGQKQRVAIARTLIRKPKVLLLDEATSALDEDSQKLVQEALERSMQDRTTIIIAHRLSTIEKCQKIFLLEDGRVKEEGGFNELKQKGGAFANLTKSKQ